MSFLPQELPGSDEWSWMFEFPSNDVGPLVELEWQVSVTLDPIGVSWIHDSLTGWSDGDWFSEVGIAGLSDPRDFR